MKYQISGKNKLLDTFIVALLIVNVGFYFYEKHARAEPRIQSPVQMQAIEPQKTIPEKRVNSFSIQFFGDIMLDRNVAKKMATSGLDYIFKKSISENESLFKNTDLRIANLEGPFAETRIKTGKSIAFRFDPALAPQLKKYGFTAFDLANNHSNDMGKANVVFTRDTLQKNGIQWFGNELDEGQDYVWISTGTQKKIAFLGLHNTYHQLNMTKVESALKYAKDNSDYVAVNIHFGEEYKTLSNKKQQTLAHWLVDKGADIVIGHHPHVIEEAEIYKDKPIFYSLGNFVFDQYFSPETQTGLSVVLKLDERERTLELVPFKGVASQDIPLSGAEKADFLEKFEKNSRLGDKKIVNGIIKF